MEPPTEFRPSAALRATWLGLAGAFGAAAGLAVTWYTVVLITLLDLTRAERAGGARPPDLLERVTDRLWPETLLPSVCAGAVAAVIVAALAARRNRSRQAWRARRWLLGGGAVGAVLGMLGGALLVGAWSVVTLNFSGAAPSITTQSHDIMVFGLLILAPVTGASVAAATARSGLAGGPR